MKKLSERDRRAIIESISRIEKNIKKLHKLIELEEASRQRIREFNKLNSGTPFIRSIKT